MTRQPIVRKLIKRPGVQEHSNYQDHDISTVFMKTLCVNKRKRSRTWAGQIWDRFLAADVAHIHNRVISKTCITFSLQSGGKTTTDRHRNDFLNWETCPGTFLKVSWRHRQMGWNMAMWDCIDLQECNWLAWSSPLTKCASFQDSWKYWAIKLGEHEKIYLTCLQLPPRR